MGTLYVAVDLFCPSAYVDASPSPGAESYAHLGNSIFAVLQPILTTDGSAGTIPLADYFTLDGPALGQNHSIVFLTEDVPQATRDALGAKAVPVPFPPATELVLSWNPGGGANDIDDARVIPGFQNSGSITSPLMLATGDWPKFATCNFALPPVRLYKDLALLRADRQAGVMADLFAWGIGLTTHILHLKHDPSVQLTPAEQTAYNIVAGLDAPPPRPPISEKDVRDYLKQPIAAPRIGQLWEQMLVGGAGGTRPILAPRFAHDEVSLQADPVRLLDLLADPKAPQPIGVSYHRKVWRDMGGLIRNGNATPATQALGRLFGFGERLRWPKAWIDATALMVLDTDSQRGAKAGWDSIGTNVQSLLGQVFKTPVGTGALAKDAKLSVKVLGTTLATLVKSLQALKSDLGAPLPVTVTVARDADRPKGFFIYAPKMANFSKAVAPGALGSVYAVPSALLDAVDRQPRWSSPPGDHNLAVVRPPRSGLRTAELYHPELAGTANTRRLTQPVSIQIHPVSPRTPVTLFSIGLPGSLHGDERTEIENRFRALITEGGSLWLPQRDGTIEDFSLAQQVLAIETDEDGTLSAIIADTGNGALKTAFDGLQRPAGGTPGAAAQIDLVFAVTATGDPLFNRVFGGLTTTAIERPPLALLKNSFTSRVSLSTDRLMDRLEASFSPNPFAPGADGHAVLRQLANFNKARFALASDAPEVIARAPKAPKPGDPYVTFLTYPDAVAPMDYADYAAQKEPWMAGPSPDSGRHYSFFVSHAFTQDAKADEIGDQASRSAAESLRYLNVLTPDTPWRLDGNVEHQYTQRITIVAPQLKLGLAGDIQHAASTATRGDGSRLNLVEWSLVLTGPSAPLVRLAFPRTFLSRALERPANADERPARLRVAYEPLADLISAIDHGSATLRLERWAFHSDGPQAGAPPPGPQAANSGALSSSMRLVGSHLRGMSAADPQLADLKRIRDLLAGPFASFQTQLVALAGSTGDWLVFDLPLSTGWSGLADPTVVHSESDVLRLGLTVARPSASIATTDYLDPAHLDRAPGFGLPVDDKTADEHPELKNENFAVLKENAAKELLEYFQPQPPSPLRESFAWFPVRRAPITPTPAPAPGASDPETVNDPKRFERLFGESATYLELPDNFRPQVDRVMDLFYAPLAFRPLQAHGEIGDTETTLEFAEFILQALDDIANGRPAQGFIPTPTSAADAQTLQSWARSDMTPKIAALATGLVTWVHNDARAGSGDDARFDYVHVLMQGVLNGGMREEIKRMLRQTPGLFATTKGIGLVIIEPSAWNDQVHSLQLAKQIHPGEPTKLSSIPEGSDVDQFVFPRILMAGGTHAFIDVLDDARYDDEFEIDETEFVPPRPPWGLNKGAVSLSSHTIKTRGDVQGRTGEDVIELHSRFDDPPLSPRQLEADVVHWNPNWILTPKTVGPDKPRKFYLLPSRRAPATPVKLKPGGLARCPLPLAFASPGDQPKLDVQIKAHLNKRLDDNNVLSFGTSKDQTLTATRLPKPLFSIQEVKTGPIAPGWWHQESYASEHYFLIETDEELNTGDTPFANDRIRIEVETGPTPFADEDPAAPADFKVSGKLGAWFNYQRLTKTNPLAPNQPPPAIPLKDIKDEFLKWLTPANPNDGLLVAATAPTWSGTGAKANTHVASFSPGPNALRQSVSDPAIGSVLAAEIMQLQTDQVAKGRYVLRLMVLDEAWRYTRVRVRLERNFVDIDGDGVPDINPAFQMIGAFSAWSSHGREVAEVDFLQRQRDNLPLVLSQFRPPTKASDYIGQPGPFDYGDLLGAAIDATFKDSNYKDYTFWNVAQARSQGFGLGGLILQHRPDLHPRVASAEQTQQFDSRTEDIPRMHLPHFEPANDATPRDLSPLLKAIDKTHVPSPHHTIRVIWSNAKGEAMLVSTWPVVFVPD